MLKRFSHVMIFARRHAETVRWYVDALGFEIDYHAPGEYASLHHRELGRLAVHAAADDADIGRGPQPYFLCEDLDATLAGLEAAGAKVGEPRREGESPRFSHFADPEGNVWGVEEL